MIETTELSARNGEFVMDLPIASIAQSSFNPRRQFDPLKLRQLADSIAEKGIIQPIVVRPLITRSIAEINNEIFDICSEIRAVAIRYDKPFGNGFNLEEHICAHPDYCKQFEGANIDEHGYILQRLREERWRVECINRHQFSYEIVAGERRWRAAQLAKLETIPAIIKQLDDIAALEIAVIENEAREDLNPIERAEGFDALRKLGHKVRDIAEKIGLQTAQSSVSNCMRLLELPEDIREMIRSGQLSQSAGKALVSYVQYPKILKFMLQLAKGGVAVKKLEDISIHSWELKNCGAVVSIVSADVGVAAAKECQKCKHQRKHNGNGWLCLDTDCAEAKMQAQRSKRCAELISATGLSECTEILSLQEQGYDSYKSESYCIFEECSKCDKKRLALNYSNKPELICVDMKCYRCLATSGTRAKNAVRRAAAADLHNRAMQLFENEELDTAKLIVLTCFRTLRFMKSNIRSEVLKKYGVEDIRGYERHIMASSHKLYEEILKTLSAVDLMKCAAEMIVVEDTTEMKTNEYHVANITEWFLGDPPSAEFAYCAQCGDVCGPDEWKYNDLPHCSHACEQKTRGAQISDIGTEDGADPDECPMCCSACSNEHCNSKGAYPEETCDLLQDAEVAQ